MTDKQIIINGCNVSGCEAYKDKHCKDKTSIMFCKTNLCSNFPNCYYKQHKRKEQECETLASQLDFEVQKKECLEQECEELKKENKKLKEELLDLQLQFEEEQSMYEI